MNPAEFLQTVWGGTPPGLIQLWELDGRRNFYLRAPAGAGGRQGNVDLYTGVGLTHKNHGRPHRARSEQIVAIAGLWLDLDVNGGPAGKTGAAPSKSAAEKLAHHVLEPTLLVDSGHGVHAWWLFDQPWKFTSRDDQDLAQTMSAQWYALHRQISTAQGWTIDGTHDLARLLRLPGTYNGKGGQRVPVHTLLSQPDRRYPRQLLQETCEDAGPVNAALPRTDGPSAQLSLVPTGLPQAKFDALLFNDPEFAAAWNHQLHLADQSTSAYDLSLCSRAARAGWTDGELAALIVAHRQRYAAGDTKGTRGSYVGPTITKARANAINTARADTVRELAERGRAAA